MAIGTNTGTASDFGAAMTTTLVFGVFGIHSISYSSMEHKC
jgi:hypothetical protein